MIFLLGILFIFNTYAYEYTDAFVVKVFSDHVKVTSPKKYDKNQSVIVENRTQVKVIMNLQGESGTNYSYFSIPPRKSQSKKLTNYKKEKLFLVPMSPALQRVHLKLGSLPYEIPEKE